VFGRAEGDHSGKRPPIAEIDRLPSVRRVLGEGVEDPRPLARARAAEHGQHLRAALAVVGGQRGAEPPGGAPPPPRRTSAWSATPSRAVSKPFVACGWTPTAAKTPVAGSASAAASSESARVVPGTRKRVTPAARARAIISAAPFPICRWQCESASSARIYF